MSSEAGSDGEKEVKSERKVSKEEKPAAERKVSSSKEEKPVVNGIQLDPLKISNGHNGLSPGDVSGCVCVCC